MNGKNQTETTALATRQKAEVGKAIERIWLDDETKAIVVNDDDGRFVRAIIDIPVNAKEGDVWRFGLRPGDYVMDGPGKPTAKLLQRIAGIIGLQLVNPPTQIIGRETYPNPYIDETKGEVWYFTRAIGRSFATGELRIMQQTMVLRINSAFAQGIADKIKKGKFPANAYAYVGAGMESEFRKEHGYSWIEVALSAPGVKLFVDATRNEFAEAINDHEKFYGSLTKRAKNIADRNIIESFLGLSQIIMKGGRGVYKAVVWRPMNRSEVAYLHNVAADGGEDDNDAPDAEDLGIAVESDGSETAAIDGEVIDDETGEVINANEDDREEEEPDQSFEKVYEEVRGDRESDAEPKPSPLIAELDGFSAKERAWCLKQARLTEAELGPMLTDDQLAALRQKITVIKMKRGVA